MQKEKLQEYLDKFIYTNPYSFIKEIGENCSDTEMFTNFILEPIITLENLGVKITSDEATMMIMSGTFEWFKMNYSLLKMTENCDRDYISSIEPIYQMIAPQNTDMQENAQAIVNATFVYYGKDIEELEG